jgi:hypothetical protein
MIPKSLLRKPIEPEVICDSVGEVQTDSLVLNTILILQNASWSLPKFRIATDFEGHFVQEKMNSELFHHQYPTLDLSKNFMFGINGKVT